MKRAPHCPGNTLFLPSVSNSQAGSTLSPQLKDDAQERVTQAHVYVCTMEQSVQEPGTRKLDPIDLERYFIQELHALGSCGLNLSCGTNSSSCDVNSKQAHDGVCLQGCPFFPAFPFPDHLQYPTQLGVKNAMVICFEKKSHFRPT